MLKRETIEELKRIMKENYGKDLSMQEATEAANILVGYFDILAQADFHDKNNEHKANTS